jgi:chorismate mutase
MEVFDLEKQSLQERLSVLRAEIDGIDQQLMLLLVKRFASVIEIAEIKHTLGLEMYDPDRESIILKQIGTRLGENESLLEIISLFECLLNFSKKAQNKHLVGLEKQKNKLF